MALVDLLLTEFDAELAKTRATLERLPEDQPDFKPHEKSRPLVKLADHTAEIPDYVPLILATEEFDLANRGPKPDSPASNAERLERFDAAVKTAREKLAETTDDTLYGNWRLSAGGHTLLSGTKYQAVRNVFFNHMIHHRAQLGIYLRLTGCPVPPIYGPSADQD